MKSRFLVGALFVVATIWTGASPSWAALSASDDFESYAGNPTDTAGGSGDWTTNWTGNSQFDGGTFLNTAAKINASPDEQSYGLFGSGGSNGTSVRRAFTRSEERR